MKFLYSLVLIFCLSGCTSPFLSDLLVKSGGVLYQEGFTDPNSGWARASEASGSLDYAANGTYQVSVDSPNYDLWAVSGHAYRDVRLEVDTARLAGPQENRFGLVCRYKDPENFYFFVISSDGYQAIGKVIRGAQTLLSQDMLEYSPAVLTGESLNHLRFDCIGSELSAYVNQQPVSTVDDADFTKGDAGLIVGTFDQPGVKVMFDNFIVYKP
jgi:hypothetical protein